MRSAKWKITWKCFTMKTFFLCIYFSIPKRRWQSVGHSGTGGFYFLLYAFFPPLQFTYISCATRRNKGVSEKKIILAKDSASKAREFRAGAGNGGEGLPAWGRRQRSEQRESLMLAFWGLKTLTSQANDGCPHRKLGQRPRNLENEKDGRFEMTSGASTRAEAVNLGIMEKGRVGKVNVGRPCFGVIGDTWQWESASGRESCPVFLSPVAL